MLMRMFVCMSVDCRTTNSFCINNKGHSLSGSGHVIVSFSVCDFVLTVFVTITEATDL